MKWLGTIWAVGLSSLVAWLSVGLIVVSDRVAVTERELTVCTDWHSPEAAAERTKAAVKLDQASASIHRAELALLRAECATCTDKVGSTYADLQILPTDAGPIPEQLALDSVREWLQRPGAPKPEKAVIRWSDSGVTITAISPVPAPGGTP